MAADMCATLDKTTREIVQREKITGFKSYKSLDIRYYSRRGNSVTPMIIDGGK